VRTYATDPEEAGNEDLAELEQADEGLNSHAWDFRTEGLTPIEGLMSYGSLAGRQLPPGRYQVRLVHGADVATEAFEVLPDPRHSETATQYAKQDRLVADAQDITRDLTCRFPPAKPCGVNGETAGFSRRVPQESPDRFRLFRALQCDCTTQC